MALPNPSMDFTAFDNLPAASLDDLVENIEAIQDGSSAPVTTNVSKNLLTTDSNPYKFSAYLAASQTGITDAVFTKIVFDTEKFDTNSNFATGRYTAPVNGFYQINAYCGIQSSNNTGVASIISIYKNGAEFLRHDMHHIGAANVVLFGGTISELVQLVATDYLEVFVYIDFGSGSGIATGGALHSRFSGFLVSKT